MVSGIVEHVRSSGSDEIVVSVVTVLLNASHAPEIFWQAVEVLRSWSIGCIAPARYDLAVPRSFAILPRNDKMRALAADYRDMSTMSFWDPPRSKM